MARAYYNENDPRAAEWLRQLIKHGHIAEGFVDERSITEVRAADLAGYTQCHFFAGIGGWSYALRLAGWPDNRPVWTGSCPCQPFSEAGKQEGITDPRHLWPDWFRLIRECRPITVFGEQVAAAIRHGWFDLVSTDMEGDHYAIGAAVMGAHSVGSPNIRQRLYFVAHTTRGRCGEFGNAVEPRQSGHPDGSFITGGMAITNQQQRNGGRDSGAGGRSESSDRSSTGITLGNTKQQGLERHPGDGNHGDQPGRIDADPARPAAAAGPTSGFWGGAEWIMCTDGKARPVEPGTFPLAHGIPGRVGLLRGYGNAINTEAAAEFVRAYGNS